MRERIVDELGGVAHPELLVYLMGPYTAFDVGAALEGGADPTEVVDLSALPESFDARTVRDADLVRQVRLFVRDVARREQTGDLPRLD